MTQEQGQENTKKTTPGEAADEITIKASPWDWPGSILHLIAFFLILFLFDPIQRIAMLFGRKYQQHVVVRLNDGLVGALKLFTGLKLEVEQFGTIEPNQAIIVISNHQSYFDIVFLIHILRKHFPRFIAKKELAQWIPSISYNLRYGGSAIIDRKDPRQAIPEIQRLGKAMTSEGFASVLFPEGTRARTGTLKPFRYAGFASLLQCAPHAKVVPVTIDSSWKLTYFNLLPIPRNVTVKFIIGAPIERGEHDSLKDFIQELHAIIEANLNKIRSESEE